MTLLPKTNLNNPLVDLSTQKKETNFNWQKCWYPVSFVEDLPKNKPLEFSLYGESLVIFRNQEKELVCLKNICPHRAAKLSDGEIVDGKLECPYHGWQFGKEGKCLHIPQLPEGEGIQDHMYVKYYSVLEIQGMIWIWAGDTETADKQLIPTIPQLELSDFVSEDKVYDFPCEQSFLIENILDPAHVNIIHSKTQAKKKDAQPLEMKVLETSERGFKGKWRWTKNTKIDWVLTDFIAPNLVFHYFTLNEKLGWNLGLAVYSIPLGDNKTRVFVRIFRNFFTIFSKLTPRWYNHLKGCAISEEDIKVLMGQQKQIEQEQKYLKELYNPLKTSDIFVVEYRNWLDMFGTSLPIYRGMSNSRTLKYDDIIDLRSINRFEQHTSICNSCSNAHKRAIAIANISTIMAIIFFAITLFTNDVKAEIILLISIILKFSSDFIKINLERSIFHKDRY